MTLPVITAVSDAAWEADLVGALDRSDLGLSVVRRCVDIADLLAAAATGTARAAVVSGELRGLDREALARLAVATVAVVVLVPDADDDPEGEVERRIRQLGVDHVLPSGTAPAEIAAAVVRSVAAAGASRASKDFGDPARPPARVGQPESLAAVGPAPAPDPRGRVIAVWGPTGAPGRTTVAVGVASELAQMGLTTLVVDADVYGGVVAQALGLLEESPGVAAACRLATSGSLDVPALAGLVRAVGDGLGVLTGIARADRWPELRPSALEVVLELSRRLADVVVVDCGFGLEQDEELSYDTAAPRRNGATLSVLAEADDVLAVGAADPVSLQRLVRGLADLREAAGVTAPTVVVNRLRRGAIGRQPEAQVAEALHRYAGVGDVSFVPLDVAGCDAALSVGRTLAEAAPGSPARAALQELAGRLAGHKTVQRNRAGRRRRAPWRRAG